MTIISRGGKAIVRLGRRYLDWLQHLPPFTDVVEVGMLSTVFGAAFVWMGWQSISSNLVLGVAFIIIGVLMILYGIPVMVFGLKALKKERLL